MEHTVPDCPELRCHKHHIPSASEKSVAVSDINATDPNPTNLENLPNSELMF